VASGNASREDVQHNGLEMIEFVVQMLDAGDQVELLDHDPDSLLEGALVKRSNSFFALAPWHTRWSIKKTKESTNKHDKTLDSFNTT
jgi:hypothetical protein